MAVTERWTPESCRRLRWKGMFVDAEPDPTVPSPGDGFCWCSLTAGLLGPDGRPAERDACDGRRSCYEAS